MAINLDAMRAKLEQSKNGGNPSGNKSTMWRPQAGAQHIRILPTSDGDPFREFHFHYNVGKNPGIYCSKRNDGGECPICDFASKLWRDGVANDDQNLKNEAKKLFARKRYYSPVLVRGNESEGVKIWAYGKTAYETLLGYVLDPDYGDITDPETGNDLKLMYGKLPGASFPRTDIRPRPRKTVLCDDAVGGDERCAELLETIPNFDELFERKTTEEVQSIMDQHLSANTGNSEVEKFGGSTVDSSVDSVEAAFSDLLNQ